MTDDTGKDVIGAGRVVLEALEEAIAEVKSGRMIGVILLGFEEGEATSAMAGLIPVEMAQYMVADLSADVMKWGVKCDHVWEALEDGTSICFECDARRPTKGLH